MKKQLKFFLLGALMAPLSAWCISKVGNAKIGDCTLGFQSDIPEKFVYSRESVDNGALLVSLLPSWGSGPLNSGSLPLFIKDFSFTFPELKGKGREQIQDFFLKYSQNAWSRQNSPDPCVDVFYLRNQSTDAVIAVWASNKGVVFVGPKDHQIRRAVVDMAQSLRLDSPEACGW